MKQKPKKKIKMNKTAEQLADDVLMVKQSFDWNELVENAKRIGTEYKLPLAVGGTGATLGGLAGALEPEEEKRKRKILLGALLGGGAGTGLGFGLKHLPEFEGPSLRAENIFGDAASEENAGSGGFLNAVPSVVGNFAADQWKSLAALAGIGELVGGLPSEATKQLRGVSRYAHRPSPGGWLGEQISNLFEGRGRAIRKAVGTSRQAADAITAAGGDVAGRLATQGGGRLRTVAEGLDALGRDDATIRKAINTLIDPSSSSWLRRAATRSLGEQTDVPANTIMRMIQETAEEGSPAASRALRVGKTMPRFLGRAATASTAFAPFLASAISRALGDEPKTTNVTTDAYL